MGVKRSKLIETLKKSFIENTNRSGYIDMNDNIASSILEDLEKEVNIEYQQEVSSEQLSFVE